MVEIYAALCMFCSMKYRRWSNLDKQLREKSLKTKVKPIFLLFISRCGDIFLEHLELSHLSLLQCIYCSGRAELKQELCCSNVIGHDSTNHDSAYLVWVCTLQVGAFSVLKELAIVLPKSLSEHMGSLVPGIERL